MDLEVLPAEESDMDRLMEIQFSAFENDPYHYALYPGDQYSPEVRKDAARRTIEEWRGDPTLHVLKCVDRKTGKAVGMAQWNIYDKERPKEQWATRPPITWATGRQEEIAKAFLYSSLAMREKTWEGRPHCMLAILTIHQDYQRKGAGTLLVQWGLEKAKQLGLPAYLEASPAGKFLYTKLGFHQIDTVVVKKEMWDGDRDMFYIAMLKRPEDSGS